MSKKIETNKQDKEKTDTSINPLMSAFSTSIIKKYSIADMNLS